MRTLPVFALLLALAAGLLTACNLGDVASAVPTTGNTAGDASAAQQFLPSAIPGYVVTDANSITSALSTVSGGASAIAGNPVLAAAIGAVDGLIQCYNGVGAAAARIYISADVANVVMNGAAPNFGAMAVINSDRIVNNFLPCALGQAQSFSAQSADQPQICTNNGSFVVNGETLYYLYAATTPDLCGVFQAAVPAQ